MSERAHRRQVQQIQFPFVGIADGAVSYLFLHADFSIAHIELLASLSLSLAFASSRQCYAIKQLQERKTVAAKESEIEREIKR